MTQEETISGLASLYEESKNDLVVATVAELEARNAGCPVALLWKARSLQLVDRPSESLSEVESTLHRALRMEADYVPAILELAWFYLNVNDDAVKAAPLFSKAVVVQKRCTIDAIRGLARSLSEAESKDA